MSQAAPSGQVIHTKLTPPRLPRHTLARPRLTALLLEAQRVRLTLVQAGTGYGKSTALATLEQESLPLAWYHLEGEDADPLVFLLHLTHTLHTTLPTLSAAPLALLEQREQTTEMWTAVVDTLVNELSQNAQPLLLVLDDAHHLNANGETLRILDRLIGRSPQTLHVILSSRYPMQLPTLLNWRVRGDVLDVTQEALAFTPAEIARLFQEQFVYPLTAEQVELLATRSEGWPIALQLVWQRLQGGSVTLDEALGQLSGGDLFAYLAQEVLAQQPTDVQGFLRETAVLRQFTADLCDALRNRYDSRALLRYLRENGLFLVDLGDGHLRYHHLFRDLLHHQLAPDRRQLWHQKAASLYLAQTQPEEAIYHLLEAGDPLVAAQLLDSVGRDMVQAGRLDTLASWLTRLDPLTLEAHPPLLAYLGDIARLRSHFDEALGWYKQAELRSRAQNNIPAIGQALRGQARVYLDTVNATQADVLLQEALRLSEGQDDRESRARLLDLLAENMLNLGRLEQAQAYQVQARELRHEGPDMAEIPVRLLLRTGRLDEARRLLEERLRAEQQEPVNRPRAHRETLLILSLILALQGEQEAAFHYAVEGTRRGERLQSQFVTAVGHMRQGHAWLLHKDVRGFEKAAHCFETAVALSEQIDVPRLKVEAYWGLCQAYGFSGDLDRAQETAVAGIALAQAAGDEWVMACIRVTLGAAYALAEQYQAAIPWLAQADAGFRESGDSYGQTVTRLWQSVVWHNTHDTTRLHRDVTDLLRLAQTHQYGYLFQRPTLLGPPHPPMLTPLLLVGRDHTNQTAYATQLLQTLGLARLHVHPGYQLRLQLLGPFRAWRGMEEITAQDWKRKKARQLFLLLATYQPATLEREQIVEMLWPELDPEQAQRDFKIAYSSLLNVLEPQRERNAPSAFIVRDDSRYGLRAEADVWLDAAEFERLVAAGDALYSDGGGTAVYRQAIQLYHGDFLQEYPYETWCSEHREHLLTMFLQTAERLALLLLQQQAWDEAIRTAHTILEHDNCWEQAYRVLMQAYAAQGKRAQAIRTYQRCQERLQTELGVQPSAATVNLYQELRQQGL